MPTLNLKPTGPQPKRLSDIPAGHVAQSVRFPDLVRLVCNNGKCVTIENASNASFDVSDTSNASFLYYDLGPLTVEI